MVDKKDWGKHVAKPVRITFRDGRLREGRLSEIDGERVRLEMQLSAGSITLPIKIGEIKQVEVAE
jgi:ribosome maturation factor RimP